MGQALSTHVGEEECKQGSCGKARRKETSRRKDFREMRLGVWI
jgi:hypothetical protein